MVKIYTVFNCYVADTCASERREISAAVQGKADVACQGPDIGALAADHPDGHAPVVAVEVGELYLLDMYALGFQDHALAVAPIFIRPFAVHLHGAVGRRHLVDVADEALQGRLGHLTRDMAPGIGVVDAMLQVVAVGSGTKLQGRRILLGVSLELLYLLRATPGTEDEDARGQRVQGAGMSHLDLLPHMLREQVTDMGQGSEAAHAVGLVDSDNLAFDEIHIS